MLIYYRREENVSYSLRAIMHAHIPRFLPSFSSTYMHNASKLHGCIRTTIDNNNFKVYINQNEISACCVGIVCTLLEMRISHSLISLFINSNRYDESLRCGPICITYIVVCLIIARRQQNREKIHMQLHIFMRLVVLERSE